MGNFLHSPITEKTTHTGQGNGLYYGVSSMQGWRATMEDSHTTIESIEGFETASLYGVFDGHGGTLAAEYSAKELITAIRAAPNFNNQITPEMIGEIMVRAFMNVDDSLRQLPQVCRNEDHSGCTAIAAFLTATHIIVANSGDSRSVLAKSGLTEPMSFDHKPYDEKEKLRIEQAGGAVRNKRVNGDLAVSRALGDFVYKNRPDMAAVAQQVSAEPDIKIEERNGTEEFLIIACDGIWDVMSNDDVCAYVRNLLMMGERDFGLIAEELIDHCLDLGSRDNMSVVVVAFPGITYGTGNGVAGLRAERAKRAEAEAAISAAAAQDFQDPPPTQQ